MMLITRILTALAGPKLANWLTASLTALATLFVLLVARHRGRAAARAEMEAQNARARAERKAELAALRDEQLKAASQKPDEDELDKILKDGRF